MKLKTFSPETIPTNRSIAPKIGMNQKNGCITFNAGAREKLAIKENSEVLFHQDEDQQSEWYLEVVKNGGFKIRFKETDSSAKMQSTGLVRKIFESAQYEEVSGNLLIGKEPIKNGKSTYWPLITASLINK